MSTLSFQDALLIGKNYHMCRLKLAGSEESVEGIRARHQPNDMSILVNRLRGESITLELNDDYTVEELKALTEGKLGIPSDEQRLFFGREQLEDGKTLREYKVQNGFTLHLVLRLQGAGSMPYEKQKEFFSEMFDYDFTSISIDEQPFYRGGTLYTRPLGSMRYALNVLDKYGDNVWLGSLGRQSADSSVDGEWPVAYYGTTDPCTAEVVSDGLDLKKEKRFGFRHGIYCTPDPKIALTYASPYEHNGKTYKLIVEARVDPSRLEIVPKSKHCAADLDDYWIAKEEEAIRPYGICVYPC